MSDFALKRLNQDYLHFLSDPIAYIDVAPLPDNMLVWHYVFTGPKDSEFAGGIYHGKVCFPKEYPFQPPTLFMFTPNGVFDPAHRICTTASDKHPELWNPAWNASTILNGLISLMCDRHALQSAFLGPDYRKTLVIKSRIKTEAYNSLDFNLKNSHFCLLFPDIVTKSKKILSERKAMGLPMSVRGATTHSHDQLMIYAWQALEKQIEEAKNAAKAGTSTVQVQTKTDDKETKTSEPIEMTKTAELSEKAKTPEPIAKTKTSEPSETTNISEPIEKHV